MSPENLHTVSLNLNSTNLLIVLFFLGCSPFHFSYITHFPLISCFSHSFSLFLSFFFPHIYFFFFCFFYVFGLFFFHHQDFMSDVKCISQLLQGVRNSAAVTVASFINSLWPKFSMQHRVSRRFIKQTEENLKEGDFSTECSEV